MEEAEGVVRRDPATGLEDVGAETASSDPQGEIVRRRFPDH